MKEFRTATHEADATRVEHIAYDRSIITINGFPFFFFWIELNYKTRWAHIFSFFLFNFEIWLRGNRKVVVYGDFFFSVFIRRFFFSCTRFRIRNTIKYFNTRVWRSNGSGSVRKIFVDGIDSIRDIIFRKQPFFFFSLENIWNAHRFTIRTGCRIILPFFYFFFFFFHPYDCNIDVPKCDFINDIKYLGVKKNNNIIRGTAF